MSETTGIEWCDHTFNPWSGCAKVSPGCAHCYAAALPPKMRRGAMWGPDKRRVEASDAYWLEPFRWHAKAVQSGVMSKVFTGSTMDIGEDRPELVPLRDRALALVALTSPVRLLDGHLGGLNHLWLTKRPEVLAGYFADPGLYERVLDAAEWFRRRIPSLSQMPIPNPQDLAAWYPHLWVGTSVEDQRAADERIPYLLRVPARVRFLSCEPLLGPVDLARVPFRAGRPLNSHDGNALYIGNEGGHEYAWSRRGMLSWVIVGGESGRHARPMHPYWARSLRDQCVASGVPFFFKQWGEWAPDCIHPDDTHATLDRKACRTVKRPTPGHMGVMFRCGKSRAGRRLDGRTWDGMPREAP